MADVMVKIEVPFKDISIHMDGALDHPWGWFRLVKQQKDGEEVKALFVLVTDDEYAIDYRNTDSASQVEEERVKVVASLKLPVKEWRDVQFNFGSGPVMCPVVKVNQNQFAKGLQQLVEKTGQRAEYKYLGDGEWDIDAAGYDSILQQAIFGEQIFG